MSVGGTCHLVPYWLITVLILAFLFKRPNLLRTPLNEHVKSFQIKGRSVRVMFILISGRFFWIQGATRDHATTHKC